MPFPTTPTERAKVGRKVAATVVSAVIATVQPCVPEQGAPHPVNAFAPETEALRVTEVPLGKLAWQTLVPPPHSIPAGLEVTVPIPLPTGLTVSDFPEEEWPPEQAAAPRKRAIATGTWTRIIGLSRGKCARVYF